MSGFRPFDPPSPPPVDVRDVGTRPVPFLRPFPWVAESLRSFRERPLPGSYTTEAVPTFNLFGTSRIQETHFEEFLGTLGQVEAAFPRVASDKWRWVLSMEYSQDDVVAHVLQPMRIVEIDGTFPTVVLADEARGGVAPPGVRFTVGPFAIPPSGTAGATVEAIAVGARITLRALFLEMDVGEPNSGLA